LEIYDRDITAAGFTVPAVFQLVFIGRRPAKCSRN